MSDIVKRLRTMHLETAMPIYCAAANAIEQAEAERGVLLRAFAWIDANAMDWYTAPTPDIERVIDAARKLAGG